MRRSAALIAEDRVFAVGTVAGEAALAAVKPAVEAEAPVPAARRLEQVAADRAHRAELRRGGLRAGLAQHLRDLRIDLELGEGRPRADRRPLDPARHDG